MAPQTKNNFLATLTRNNFLVSLFSLQDIISLFPLTRNGKFKEEKYLIVIGWPLEGGRRSGDKSAEEEKGDHLLGRHNLCNFASPLLAEMSGQ